MSEAAALFRAIGWALSGTDVVPPAQPVVRTPAVIGWLESQGWPAERLRQVRTDRMSAELSWPWALPDELAEGLAWAQFHALLTDVRAALGLSGLVSTPRARHRGRQPGDERLLREVPPHHG